MPDDIDDLAEALKGLLGATWEYRPDGTGHFVSAPGTIKLDAPGVSFSNLSGFPTLYLGKPDPIQQNLSVIPRTNARDKSIYIQFEHAALGIYEEDEFGSKHLRFSIKYENIHSILATTNNQLVSPDHINLLELVAELRSTQASLFETAHALRDAKRHEAVARDSEIARLKALLQVAEEKAKKTEKDNFQLRLEKTELVKELTSVKESIQKRQQQLEKFELFDASDDV